MMQPLRVIFMGTPELACASLQALKTAPYVSLVGIVTQPDRPKGRDLKLQPSPVKALAQGWEVPIFQPERARDERFIEALRGLRPDLIAVAAFGQILPKALLDLPQFGCINVHTSLLPKYRGAGPIQWAILNDEPETGVTIMKMDVGLDTGDILTQRATRIMAEDNAQTLHDRLATMGAELLVETIPGYIRGEVLPRPQPAEGVSHAPKIRKTDGLIDWMKPARHCWNRIRGLVPWPGAFAYLPAETQPLLVKLWQAELTNLRGPAGQVLQADKSGIVVGCGEDSVKVTQLQREGGRRLSAADFLAGFPMRPGLQLVTPSIELVRSGEKNNSR